MSTVFAGLRKEYSASRRKTDTGAPQYSGAPWFAIGAVMEAAHLKAEVAKKEKELEARRIAQRQVEIDAQDRIEGLFKAGSTLIDEIAALEAELDMLREELATKEAKAESLRKELDAFKHTCDSLREKCSSLIDERDAAVRERDTAIRERDTIIEERDTLAHERDFLRGDLASVTVAKDQLVKESEQQRRIMTNMDTAILHEHRHNAKLQASLNTAQADKKQLEASLHAAQLNNKQLEASLDTTQASGERLEARIVNLEASLDVASQTIASCKASEAAISRKLDVTLLTLAHVEAEKSSAIELNAAEKEELRASIKTLEEELAAQISNHANATGDNDAADSDYSIDTSDFALQVEKELLEYQLGEEVAAHAQSIARADDLDLQLNAVLIQVNALKKGEVKSAEEHTELKATYTKELEDHGNTRLDLAVATDAKNKLEKRVESLQRELNEIGERAHDFMVQRKLAQQGEQRLQQELDRQLSSVAQMMQMKIEDDNKTHDLMSELNTQKRDLEQQIRDLEQQFRELSISKRSVQEVLNSMVHRCEDLQTQMAAHGIPVQNVRHDTAAYVPSPKIKAVQAVKENQGNSSMSGTARFFSRLSLGRQTTAPLSNGSAFNSSAADKENIVPN